MEKFVTAVHGLIKKGDRFLLARRSANKEYMPQKWDIPGGHVEPGESLEEALMREIKEETGLMVEIVRPYFVYSGQGENQYIQVIYLCNFLNGEVILNPGEHDIFEWMKKEDFKDHDLIHFVQALAESQQFLEKV